MSQTKKGGVDLSPHLLLGILFGLIAVIAVLTIANRVAQPFLNPDDSRQLERSMDLLQEEINSLEEGNETNLNFKRVEKDLFLATFDNGGEHGIKECFNIPCVVLCAGETCDSYYYPREINQNLKFKVDGVAVDVKGDRDIPGFLVIKNEMNIISIEMLQN